MFSSYVAMGVPHPCPTLQVGFWLHVLHVCATHDTVSDVCYAAPAEEMPTCNLQSIIKG